MFKSLNNERKQIYIEFDFSNPFNLVDEIRLADWDVVKEQGLSRFEKKEKLPFYQKRHGFLRQSFI